MSDESDSWTLGDLIARANAQNERERSQVPAPLHACKFAFDEGVEYEGYTDDTTWNGWANVWVTPSVLSGLFSLWRAKGELPNEAMEDLAPEETIHGWLVSLNGYCVHVIEDGA